MCVCVCVCVCVFVCVCVSQKTQERVELRRWFWCIDAAYVSIYDTYFNMYASTSVSSPSV